MSLSGVSSSSSVAGEKIYYSRYPELKLPELSIWHLVFENPNAPRDDHTVFVDGITNQEMKCVVSLPCRACTALITTL